jgi:hypothetical protein
MEMYLLARIGNYVPNEESLKVINEYLVDKKYEISSNTLNYRWECEIDNLLQLGYSGIPHNGRILINGRFKK